MVIVMELLQASLLDVLYEPSFAPHAKWESALLSIASDVAKGMAYVHLHGFLHRNLKPCNILLDGQWVAKIADFGSAGGSGSDEDEDLISTATFPPYMAPEIIQWLKFTQETDVWAFGCMLSHMGTKTPPYQQLKILERHRLLEVIQSGAVSPLAKLYDPNTGEAKGMPDQVLQIAMGCCAVEPSQRPSFQSVADRLASYAGVVGGDVRPRGRIQSGAVVASFKDRFREKSKGSSSSSSGAVPASPRESPRVQQSMPAAPAPAAVNINGVDVLVTPRISPRGDPDAEYEAAAEAARKGGSRLTDLLEEEAAARIKAEEEEAKAARVKEEEAAKAARIREEEARDAELARMKAEQEAAARAAKEEEEPEPEFL